MTEVSLTSNQVFSIESSGPTSVKKLDELIANRYMCGLGHERDVSQDKIPIEGRENKKVVYVFITRNRTK